MGESNGGPSYLIDSNIFLSVFVRSDEQKWKDCSTLLHAIMNKHIAAYIPLIVMVEVQFVLDSFYRFQKHQVIEGMKGIRSTNNLRFIDDLSVELAIKLFEEHNIKFIDCLLASSKLVQEGKAAIVSYDRDFDKLGIRRLEPRDLLKQLSTR